MASLQVTLYIAGASIEFVGIIAVAAPDLLPYRDRLSAWMRRQYDRAKPIVRRLLRRPENIVIHAGPASVVVTVGGASVVKSISDTAPLAEKVAFLLRQDEKAQRRMGELVDRVAALQKEYEASLDRVRAELEERFQHDLAAALAAYRPIRALGAIAVAVGLGMATAGNFVG